ncbi:FkbM family methyltransferase [Polycladidibacter stylochi]|uniref:FkbM family methyltransferase n=1 Tax=Polycladidibacter stylochi TaxID=1807766 RepID=UPI00082D2CC7|nr:FkbM family methyltransferase [Pseudovibrio stylochi]
MLKLPSLFGRNNRPSKLRKYRDRIDYKTFSGMPVENGAFTKHHPAFERFSFFTPISEGPFSSGLDQTIYHQKYCQFAPEISFENEAGHFQKLKARQAQLVANDSMYPGINEEYFEWIDIYLSVLGAGIHYKMAELGAGYGRWGMNAAQAAVQLGKQAEIYFVEAEPQHVRWIHEHAGLNSDDLFDYEVVDGVVAAENGCCNFYVSDGQELDVKKSREWFGQSIATEAAADIAQDKSEYMGHEVIECASGAKAIEVTAHSINDLLAKWGELDLIDMDVQGEEASIIEAGIEQLSENVKRLHIGTHYAEGEARIRAALQEAGWVCLRDYVAGQKQPTPYGEIDFSDGVQSWINPRFKVIWG